MKETKVYSKIKATPGEEPFADEMANSVADPFQEIMEKVGSHGRYQLIYNIIFILGLGIAGAMCYMNIILALNIPGHWCNVPGRDKTNFTLDEWRKLTLPTQKDNRGMEKYSSCQMFDVNFTEIDDWQNWNSTSANVTDCQNGWSYDQTWYQNTIPTKENWVCAKDLFVTNVFVVGRVTEVAGSFLLGQMGDIFGRRLIYYIGVVFSSIGRLSSIVLTSHYTWFMIFSGLAALTINSLFQSPQVIAMEISREEDRSKITMYKSFAWSLGTTVMTLLFWWLRDWEAFMWITTLPTAVFLLLSSYVIESPRWLISKKRFGDAITQFKKIAKINGHQFDMSEKELAEIFSSTQQEATYGIASLFTGWRLARNTIMMGFSWCVVYVSYFTLVLLSSQISGNPFLNFLLQTIVEIPAYMTGKYSADRFGRRFTNSFSFFISFLACIPLIILATDSKYELVVMGLTTFIKFVNALTFFTTSLQAIEIYPTCMRQTGIALGTILASTVSILAPYLVYLGTTVDIRSPYYILGSLLFLVAIGALFLPETLHKKLPDTMEEARQFGIHDEFFSLPKASHSNFDGAAEKLNQEEFAP